MLDYLEQRDKLNRAATFDVAAPVIYRMLN